MIQLADVGTWAEAESTISFLARHKPFECSGTWWVCHNSKAFFAYRSKTSAARNAEIDETGKIEIRRTATS